MESTTGLPESPAPRRGEEEVNIWVASQWKLMWLHFRKHKLAVTGVFVVGIMYACALFHGFLAPYQKTTRLENYVYMPPQTIHFHDGERFSLRPFVYGVTAGIDLDTLSRTFTEDRDVKYPIKFFVRGEKHTFLGLFESDRHLFGVEEGGVVALLGTDNLGRDMFSRLLYGSAISLSIGLVGVVISFVLGCIIGGFSGYYGGMLDNVIQRLIEFLMSVPTIPLWMALAAAVPTGWSAVKVYFAMTLVLSFVGWTGLARVVRSKLLQVREEDYVMAARLAGGSDWQLIVRHLLPATMSYLIVNMTLAIPSMILGETALSFLGLGLRHPVVSWGVMLQAAQNLSAILTYPWLMIPVVPVVVFVLFFNFMGDGLRDAADPYKF